MIGRTLLLLALLWATAGGAAPLFGTKWGSPRWGTGATISYSFVGPTTFLSETNYGSEPGLNVTYDRFAGDIYRDVVADAFAMWSSVADLDFVEVADSGAPFNEAGGGDIRFWGARADPAYIAWAYFPNADPAGGDIFLNSLVDYAIGADSDGYRFDWVVMHEIGHALGLMHDGDPTSAMYAAYPVGEGRFNAGDIESIRRLYGPARVPAPTPLALLGAGVLLLGFIRRSAPDGAGLAESRGGATPQ